MHHRDYITKDDLAQSFEIFEKKITEEHEKRIQMISGHYSDVLKSNQDLEKKVCDVSRDLNCKIDDLITILQPVIDAQKLAVTIHAFLKWLGVPFTAVGLLIYWIYKNL